MASRDQQWYMDTGATSHLSSHTGNLHTSSLNRNFHSIIVGNGSSIPIPSLFSMPFEIPTGNKLCVTNIKLSLTIIHGFFYFTPATYHLFTTCEVCYDRPWPTQLFSRTPIDTEKKLGPEGSPVTDPTLYRSLAGSLQYLTFTRPDLSYAVQQLCLYMHDPREPHLNAMKRVLRYLRGTTDLGLQLFRSTTSQLIAYSDADWAGCPATRRSTSGYCVFLGDNLLTWSSKRQDTLSRSSAEAEYRGVANAVAETSWIRNLLRELHTPLFTATLVYCDNVSAVYMSANPVQHQRTKHIEIDIHFVRDKVAAGHVRVLHVPSRFQYADIFTKGLPYPLFADFRSSLSVRKSPAPTAGAY
ncbi:ribonuclease H-like domain-containing protein [Tanacetum coccineum]|uniref:Ribonuclease H-like domain-containing protein n=1 Tax=Tanacetum coccineum TaxID=301880 RepID=A0ABQ5B0Y6_9ASTR